MRIFKEDAVRELRGVSELGYTADLDGSTELTEIAMWSATSASPAPSAMSRAGWAIMDSDKVNLLLPKFFSSDARLIATRNRFCRRRKANF